MFFKRKFTYILLFKKYTIYYKSVNKNILERIGQYDCKFKGFFYKFGNANHNVNHKYWSCHKGNRTRNACRGRLTTNANDEVVQVQAHTCIKESTQGKKIFEAFKT